MLIKPVNGRSVPDPARGDILPEKGRNVEPSSYWCRRLVEGDIEIITSDGDNNDSQL